jgi:restriction system protein
MLAGNHRPLTDDVLVRYTGQTAIRYTETAANAIQVAEKDLYDAKRRLKAHSLSLLPILLRRVTAAFSTGSDVTDAGIATGIFTIPVAILLLGILRPSFPIALLTTVVAASVVFWVLWCALRTRLTEIGIDRKAARVLELQSFSTERTRLSATVAALTSHLKSRRELFVQLERAITRSEELNRLLSIELRLLNGQQFEMFLEDVFNTLGYPEVVRTRAAGDQGLDLIVSDGFERIAIQSKLYFDGKVGNDAVQQVFAGMKHYGCNRCAVITNSSYTASAYQLANSTGCRLIDGEQLRLIIAGKERI